MAFFFFGFIGFAIAAVILNGYRKAGGRPPLTGNHDGGHDPWFGGDSAHAAHHHAHHHLHHHAPDHGHVHHHGCDHGGHGSCGHDAGGHDGGSGCHG